eukprot:356114-Chlamydomonas_euryale.AAC.1
MHLVGMWKDADGWLADTCTCKNSTRCRCCDVRRHSWRAPCTSACSLGPSKTMCGAGVHTGHVPANKSRCAQ